MTKEKLSQIMKCFSVVKKQMLEFGLAQWFTQQQCLMSRPLMRSFSYSKALLLLSPASCLAAFVRQKR